MKLAVKKNHYRKVFTILGAGIIFFLVGYFSALAFVGPTSNPPGGSGAISTDASNRVGIGVSSLSNKFTVSGAVEIVGAEVFTGVGDGFYHVGGNGIGIVTGGSSRLVVSSNGRVGIGSASPPDELLHVFGNVKSTGSFIGALSGSLSAANVSTGAFGDNFGVFNYAFPGALAVGTNSTVGLQASSLYVNGNVGIGTTGPTFSIGRGLHIAGVAGTPDAVIRLTEQTSGLNNFELRSTARGTSGNRLEIGEGSDTFLTIRSDNDDGGTSLRGNVGIGTTNPGFKLDVNGTARISGAITLAGDITFGGAAATNLNMNNRNIVGVSKITVATIDPLYEIGGKKYSTYASAIAGGVKEEYVGKAKLFRKSEIPNSKSETNSNVQNFKQTDLEFSASNLDFAEPLYEYVIDFSKVESGSDLWVWRKAVDFSKDNVEVLATPYGAPATIYYEIEGEKIIFRANLSTSDVDKIEFSYRLIGKRFDWREWPTYAKDQSEQASFILK